MVQPSKDKKKNTFERIGEFFDSPVVLWTIIMWIILMAVIVFILPKDFSAWKIIGLGVAFVAYSAADKKRDTYMKCPSCGSYIILSEDGKMVCSNCRRKINI
jgi:DNA-directed RNA polymerase subunit RPC12/RpoP